MAKIIMSKGFYTRGDIIEAAMRVWRGSYPGKGTNRKFANDNEVGLDLNGAHYINFPTFRWEPINNKLEVYLEPRKVGDFIPRIHVRRIAS